MPLITVILPVYNGEKFIAAAVNSILKQSFTDFELIIINDCSIDRTDEILNSFTDHRIRLITNETNLKVVRCLNMALALASGEFIARMDADDISLPQRFERQVDFLRQHSAIDICATRAMVFGDKHHIHFTPQHHEAIKTSLLFQNTIIHPSVMMRKCSLDRFQLKYDEAFVNAEDYGLWVKVIDKLQFSTLPDVLLQYRVHDHNVSVHKEANWPVLEKINYQVYQDLFERIGLRYTIDDLKTHISIGFRLYERDTDLPFKRYMSWLKKIVLANKQSKYFDRQSLANEILEHVILIARRRKYNPIVWLRIATTFFSVFTVNDIKRYIPFKRNKTAEYYAAIAMLGRKS